MGGERLGEGGGVKRQRHVLLPNPWTPECIGIAVARVVAKLDPRRSIGNRNPTRAHESRPVRVRWIRLQSEAALVQESVMRAAEQNQVLEPRRATVRPVVDVVRVREAGSTTREPATTVPHLELAT